MSVEYQQKSITRDRTVFGDEYICQASQKENTERMDECEEKIYWILLIEKAEAIFEGDDSIENDV